MKNHLWKVTYSTVFQSSSGMQRYSNHDADLEAYVLTGDPSIPAIEHEIREVLDCQTSLTEITKAEYLGTVINDCSGACRCRACATTDEGLAMREAEG
jgi:hypothetical protein